MRPCHALVALAAALGSSGCPRNAACPPPLPAEAVRVPQGRGEGMWPLGLVAGLDAESLRSRGLEIPPERIWSGSGGLAQAALSLRGCSASFASADGLIFTNHHCAHGAISRNSTEEHNYLADGFVARTRAEELPGYGIVAEVLTGFEDVTDRVLEGLPADAAERARALDRRETEIVAACEASPATRCRVARFLDGIPYAGEPDGRQRFFLFRATELRDVRVVAAPPESVGNYGGEVDNWHWPRHTGDFAILRAYVAPDGSPAEHSADNVPFHPPAHLEVSTEGLDEGDLVMVLGYPWSTERHLTSVELEEQTGWFFPLRRDLFSEWADLLHAAEARDGATALLVAPHARRIDNALSHARGMLESLGRTPVVDIRRAEEQELAAWIAASPERGERFGSSLADIEAVVARRAASRDRDVVLRYLVFGSQLLGFARTLTKWAAERARPDLEREPGYQDRDRADVRDGLEFAQRSLDLRTDREIFEMLLRRAMALPEGQRIDALDEAVGENRSAEAIEAFARRAYEGSRLGEVEARLAMLDQDRAALEASEDAMIRLALALEETLDDRERVRDAFAQELAALRPTLMLAVGAQRGARLYPDANATARVTFGSVVGYSARDGELYTPFTTLAGVVAKHSGEDPFDAPDALLAAAREGRRGRWVDRELGDVPACFLSDVDTTGGNSGSPMLDGRGRLVGLLFDGVWDDLAGDFVYSPRVSRSIGVDIRYVLWLLDEVMGADRVLEELGCGAPAGGAGE